MNILLVGHCGPDSASLERFITDTLEGAEVSRADTADDGKQMLADQSFDLVLVNRVIPMTDELGQDWIGRMHETYSDTPFMLVSNHEDAQQEAEANGAVPGFGKRDLNTEEAAQKLKNALPDQHD
jgi:DNA-binding NtrC family response regulator